MAGRRGFRRLKCVPNNFKQRLLVRNLVTEVIIHESIQTQIKRCRLAAVYVDHVIALAKKRTLSARRAINKFVNTEKARRKLFWHLWKRYEHQEGSFCRVLRSIRRWDNARLGVVELIGTPNTILTGKQLLERQENRERIKASRRGLGHLGLATAIPDRPGTPRALIVLQSMLKPNDSPPSTP